MTSKVIPFYKTNKKRLAIMSSQIYNEWQNNAYTKDRMAQKHPRNKTTIQELMTPNDVKHIKQSLAPIKIKSIELDPINKKVVVYLLSEQKSLTSKNQSQVKLPSKLQGYEIKLVEEVLEIETEDVDLEEFGDEIEWSLIEQLKNAGYDTAKEVLSMSVNEIVRNTQINQHKVVDVFKILHAEFED